MDSCILSMLKGRLSIQKQVLLTSNQNIESAAKFEETNWVETDYNDIQKGLLPNSATRSYESTLYYNSNTANLENDADQLSFSLLGLDLEIIFLV